MPLSSGVSQLTASMTLVEIMQNGGLVANQQPAILHSHDGTFSFRVKANDDAGTIPQDSYYFLSVTGNPTPTRLAVRVPSSLGPTAQLSSLPIVLPSSSGARSLVLSAASSMSQLYSSDHPLVLVDQTLAAATLLLPSATRFSGRYTIKGVGSGSNVITLKTLASGQTIDGAPTATVGSSAASAQWISVDLVSDGTNWGSV